MNSGCYNNDISKIFHSLKAINLNGDLKVYNKDEIKFFYRGNNLDRRQIILNVTLQGKEEIKIKFKVYKTLF